MNIEAKGDWNLIEDKVLLMIQSLVPKESWEFKTWLFNHSIRQWKVKGSRTMHGLKNHWFRYHPKGTTHPMNIAVHQQQDLVTAQQVPVLSNAIYQTNFEYDRHVMPHQASGLNVLYENNYDYTSAPAAISNEISGPSFGQYNGDSTGSYFPLAMMGGDSMAYAHGVQPAVPERYYQQYCPEFSQQADSTPSGSTNVNPTYTLMSQGTRTGSAPASLSEIAEETDDEGSED